MKLSRQVVFSAGIVGIAAAAVGVYALNDGTEPEGAAPGGHVHGAAAGGTGAEVPVRLDADRAGRIGITFATAVAGPMNSLVRTVGQVAYDETRLVSVSPRIEGWVERLFVDFTGAPVAQGQPLMAVYSPMLVSAQEELILARRLLDEAGTSEALAANARGLLEAARRRLSYWDISDSEIARIERSGKPQKTLTLRAPASGLVVQKAVFQGQQIMPGMELYRIADLRTIWVEGEVFEQDLARVSVGSTARISFEAYPGESFAGRVNYIYPTLTAGARTGRIRIELDNPGLRFKPGMYVNMEFDVLVHTAGIHVPRSAVLQTGERSLVFVRAADGSLVPRQVRTGVATSDHIEVLSGLAEGEVVVTSANFLIDAESNLGTSLDAMPGAAPETTAPGSAPADPHAGHTPPAN